MTGSERTSRDFERAVSDLPAPEEIREDWNRFVFDAAERVWQRPALGRAQRGIATIAALTALQRPRQLRAHIAHALENGLSRSDVSEVIMHTAVYAGFPSGVEGMRIAQEVFEGHASR